MSAVLECDTCHRHFSVNEKGWQEFVSRITDPKDRNPYNENTIVRHLCKNCKPKDDNEEEAPLTASQLLQILANRLQLPAVEENANAEPEQAD